MALARTSLLFALFAAAFAGPAGAQGAPKGSPPAAPVEVVVARSGAVIDQVTAVGSLRANESVMVRSEIDGRIEAIRFEEGRQVRQGEVLLELNASEQRAMLAEAEAAVGLAKTSFERAKDLVQKKFVSRQAYDDALAKLREAEAQRELQQARLAKYTVRAPFAGTMGLRQSSPGDYVKAGDPIVSLVDIASLKLDFQVPEVYLAQVRVGQSVSLRLDAFPGEPFSGKVYAIEPRLDETTRSVRLQARVANADGRLRPGLFARVDLNVAHRDRAVLIPEQAIWPVGGERFVFVVTEGKARQTKVRLGQRRAGEVEVLEGLAVGDTVVTAGQARIRDGAPVNPRPAAPAPKG